ncbi:tetratricopeptide repeat protein [Desulfogranum japonicum]|uniref:tetratricopeptide repeat protein n=1 Tax=Desulfogranum japonicum TaxID=231447 RepID=UPI000410F206|nr:tetratricopeptide repeat protein [Desulfogranum japonicum]
MLSTMRNICSTLLLVLLVTTFANAASGKQQSLPPRAQILLSKISPLLQKQQYARAAALIVERQSSCPLAQATRGKGYHHAEVYFALGNCYLLNTQYQLAERAYREAVTTDPEHTHAWLNLAKTYYELEQYLAAADCFSHGYASEESKNPEVLYYAAASLLMAEKPGKAVQVFEKLFATHADAIRDPWRENYVHALLAINKNRKALPQIRLLTEHYTGEKQIKWQEILLHQYLQLEMIKEAHSYAHFLTESAPQVEKWWKTLAHIQLNMDRGMNALASLVIYSYLTEPDYKESKLIADLCMQEGIPIKAEPLYRRWLEQKNDAKLLHRLVMAQYQLGKIEEALKTLGSYQSLVTTEGLLMLKGELHYRLDQFHEAETAFKQAALTHESREGQAWLMAGYAAMQKRQLSDSRNAFTKAATFPSQKKAALVALNHLNNNQVPN